IMRGDAQGTRGISRATSISVRAFPRYCFVITLGHVEHLSLDSPRIHQGKKATCGLASTVMRRMPVRVGENSRVLPTTDLAAVHFPKIAVRGRLRHYRAVSRHALFLFLTIAIEPD